MSPTYAAETQVSSDRSIDEIRKTVRRYGANQFAFMEQTDSAAVAFVVHGRQVRFKLEAAEAGICTFEQEFTPSLDLALAGHDAPMLAITASGAP